MRRNLALFALAAGGAKPAPVAVPVLPGDGDANVAKPPPPPPSLRSTIRGSVGPI